MNGGKGKRCNCDVTRRTHIAGYVSALQMEDILALGLVSGLLFIAVYLIGKRLTWSEGEDGEEGSVRSKMFSIGGRQLVGAGVIAGIASAAAQFLLTAKMQPAATIFVQEPPF